MNKEVNQHITIEAGLNETHNLDIIEKLLHFNSHVRNHLFVDAVLLKKPLNPLKQQYLKKYGISGRLYNSIFILLEGQTEAVKELTKLNIETSKQKIKSLENQIEKLQKSVKKNKSLAKDILDYQNKIKEYKKNKNKKRKKPKMIKRIQGIHIERLRAIIKDDLFSIHQKKRSLAYRQHKLTKLELNLIKPSICWGTKDLFGKQFRLEENGFEYFSKVLPTKLAATR